MWAAQHPRPNVVRCNTLLSSLTFPPGFSVPLWLLLKIDVQSRFLLSSQFYRLEQPIQRLRGSLVNTNPAGIKPQGLVFRFLSCFLPESDFRESVIYVIQMSGSV